MTLEPKVYFLGAGPGDPDLMTVKGRRILEAADVVVFADSLVSAEHTRFAKPAAEIHRSSSLTLEEIVEILVKSVQSRRSVARLQSGDPAIYGAIHEQITHLRQAGIPFEIVPGVSSAFAAAAAVGAELTVPAVAQTVIFSRLANRTEGPGRAEVRALAAQPGTLVLFLSASVIGRVVEEVLAGGRAPDTPCVVGYKVTWPDEIILRGTLATIAGQVRQARFTKQAIILIGEAVAERGTEQLRSSLYHPAHTHLFRAGGVLPPARLAVEHPLPEAGEGQSRTARQGEGRLPLSFPGRRSGGGFSFSPAIIAVSRDGAALAGRLGAALTGSAVWVPERFREVTQQFGVPAEGYAGGFGAVFAREFRSGRPVVAIAATGIVVRALAPLVADKRTDPAVVVVDDAGRYAISLLSGHLGGGNVLAERVAALIGAQAIVTTASDERGIVPVELLGRAEGWKLRATPAALRCVAAAAVNGDPIGVFQSAGQSNWRRTSGPLALREFGDLDDLARSGLPGLVITEQRVDDGSEGRSAAAAERWVVYHPPVLVAGIGCSRGAPADEIRSHLDGVLGQSGLAIEALAALATINAKADEPGIVSLAEELGLPLRTYPAADLAQVGGPNPSALVEQVMGTPGVCEPAAILAAGGGPLLVPKRRSARVTVAVARLAGEPEVVLGGWG